MIKSYWLQKPPDGEPFIDSYKHEDCEWVAAVTAKDFDEACENIARAATTLAHVRPERA